MLINKVIYQTSIHEIIIQKYGEEWVLYASEGARHIEFKEFKFFETADTYAKNKYLHS